MKGYLVDTHAFIWYLEGSSRLPERPRRTIREEPALLSSVSLFELAILTSLNRLGSLTMADFLRPDIWEMFTLLPIKDDHLMAYEGLGFPSSHRDPFDRMLISQAKSEGFSLISADQAFEAYGILRVW